MVDGVLFLNEVIKQRNMELAREQWLTFLPNMDRNNYMSCEEYYYKLHPEQMKVLSNKSNEEILKESEEILKKIDTMGGE